MKNSKNNLLSAVLVVLAFFVLSCDGEEEKIESLNCPMQAYALTDINATSETYGQCVVPEDFSGSISGWYFGYST
jgi:hypothetical protein